MRSNLDETGYRPARAGRLWFTLVSRTMATVSVLVVLSLVALLDGAVNVWLPGSQQEPETTVELDQPFESPTGILRIASVSGPQERREPPAAFIVLRRDGHERWVYVRRGETASVELLPGVYEMRITSGYHWYRADWPFALSGRTSRDGHLVRIQADEMSRTMTTIQVFEVDTWYTPWR